MFRLAQLQILAIIMILVGGFQLVSGLTYADAAKREATTVGTILRVDCGRSSCTYVYVFEINGVRIQDDTTTCRTALSQQRCKVGTPVLVFYDSENVSGTLLQEFGEASRQRIFFGIGMISCGLLFVVVKFFLERRKVSDDSDEADPSADAEDSDVLHVVSKE